MGCDLHALIPGIRACIAGDKEHTLESVLGGISMGRYAPMTVGESFLLLEVFHDPHFDENVLNIFMAYSPPHLKGFLAEMAPKIALYAEEHWCTKVIFQTYKNGYQALIDAGKPTPGVTLRPYCHKYEVTLNGA